MPMKKLYTATVFSALLFSTNLFAEENKYDLMLNSGIVSPKEDLQVSVNNNEMFSGYYFRYVQFNEIPSTEEKEKMKSEGLNLLMYLPNYTYMAAISSSFDVNKLTSYNVRSVIAILPEYKMSETFAKGIIPPHALVGTDKMDVTIVYYSMLNSAEVKAEVMKNYEVLYENKIANIIKLRIPVCDLTKLANMPFVSTIEPIEEPNVPDEVLNHSQHRTNTLHNDFLGARQYNGTNVDVMLQDDGIIGPHIDYTGRLTHFITTNSGSHGDHCGGIIMAAGNLDPLAEGMAWGSHIYVYGASPSYPGFDSIYNHYGMYGITITSTSYSNGCNAGYTTLAQMLDMQILQMTSLEHVFSAGNLGTSNCSYGAGAGWGNISGGHKVGKNVIAVGNLDYIDVLASSSSRGPAHDGRLKPEVCGMGTNVNSTLNPNNYQLLTGTSMSCPGVAGTFAVLTETYKSLNGNVNPRSDLLKAIIMNSCDDLGNPGPDFKFGYGRINGYKAVQYIEQNRYMFGTVSQSGTNVHNITVPANTQQVKIMVYWHDYQAAVNASVALINNLNMVVTNPASTNFNPWILDYTPNATLLNNNAVRGVDIRNNHEQVTIDNPIAGNYTISINGFAVPQGPQAYVIVYEFVMSNITVTYPIGSEGYNPGETETVRWDAFGNTGTFDLDYSTDSGSTWNTLANNVSSSQRYYDWTVPSALTGKALVRVTRGTVSDVSDATFSIIGVPQNITVLWSCPDSLRLTWNAVPGATGYQIHKLGTMYMDSIGVSNSTQFTVINVQSTNTYWFSVKALGPLDAIGRRAYAIQKTPGVFGCTVGEIEPELNTNNISVFPNPSNGLFNLMLDNPNEEKITISITDVLGREIKTFNQGNTSSVNTLIDISSFAQGVYNMTISVGEKQYNIKLSNIK